MHPKQRGIAGRFSWAIAWMTSWGVATGRQNGQADLVVALGCQAGPRDERTSWLTSWAG